MAKHQLIGISCGMASKARNGNGIMARHGMAWRQWQASWQAWRRSVICDIAAWQQQRALARRHSHQRISLQHHVAATRMPAAVTSSSPYGAPAAKWQCNNL